MCCVTSLLKNRRRQRRVLLGFLTSVLNTDGLVGAVLSTDILVFSFHLRIIYGMFHDSRTSQIHKPQFPSLLNKSGKKCMKPQFLTIQLHRNRRLSQLKHTRSYLSCDGRPDFQRVVIRTADDPVATELEAGDHVVIVTFQHLRNTGQSGVEWETARNDSNRSSGLSTSTQRRG